MEKEGNDDICCFPPAGPAPWLVYTQKPGNGTDKNTQIFCKVSSSPPYVEHYLKSIPQLRGKCILSSNDGWLVLHDVDNFRMFTLSNPISSRVIHLPPMNILQEKSLLLTSKALVVCPDPYNQEDDDDDSGGGGDDVIVFFFARNGKAFSYRSPCMGNSTSTWVAHSTEVLGQMAFITNPITCDGVIYGYAYVRDAETHGLRNYFVTIDVNSRDSDFDGPLTLRVLQAESPRGRFQYITSTKGLLASCGRVYTIKIYTRQFDKRICDLEIWEWDFCLTKWVQIKSLDGRAFFLGANGCTWCWGTTDPNNKSGGVMQNYVYFELSKSKSLGMRDTLYLYNLEDCSFTSLLPCPNLPSPSYIAAWVMPRYQRLAKDEARDLLCQDRSLEDQSEQATQHKSCELGDIAESSRQKQMDELDKLLLCELPLELTVLVAKRVHLFDYLSFRATCKEYRSITPIARWRTNNAYPLLMFFESEEPLCRLMDPCRSDSCYMVIPELFRGVVHVNFSKDGWLLICTNDGEASLHFFNPFTRVSGEFPPCKSLETFSSFGFSSCPTSCDCVTVGIMCLGGDFVYYHHFEEEMWHTCVIQHHDVVDRFGFQVCSPVYYKGAFYFLNGRGYLGVFKLVNEQATCEVHGKPEIPSDDTIYSTHLVECGGDLLSVFIGSMGKWVQVYKLDLGNMKWVRVKSLPNHVLFLGPTSSSFSVVAKERGMGNRIYLARQRGNDILFYALDTGKYSILTGEESFEDFSGTKEYGRCWWI